MKIQALSTSIAYGPAGSKPPHASIETTGYQIIELTAALDMIWVLVAAALVLMMQIGFMLLEAGAVRTKNAISVAQKNLLDFAFAVIAFSLLGFGIAFGSSSGVWPFGSFLTLNIFDDIDARTASFFIFQVMFCGTAATIVSGAVAERMRLRSYILVCVILSAIVYPVFAHWAWGDALAPSSTAFLANNHFVDFAGSTVVHATGAWFALAACLLLGPRSGRFANGAPMRIGGHSAVLSSAGALFLFVGWIGFNGGSTLAASKDVPGIILNTVLAGSVGAAIGYGSNWFRGAMLPERSINGMVGGLVAITAGCHVVTPIAAILIGGCGACLANKANQILESRFQIDDAVGAIGAHGVAGVFGTIALAVVAPLEALPAPSRLAQVEVQVIGSVLNFVLAFGLGAFAVSVVRLMTPLRVTQDEEEAGLNVAEHGARLGADKLQAALEMLVHSGDGNAMRLNVEEGEDTENLTRAFNNLMDKFERDENNRKVAIATERDHAETQRIATFGEIASDSILLIFQDKIRSANAAAAVLFNVSSDSLIGRSPMELIADEYRKEFQKLLDSRDVPRHRIEIIRSDGSVAPTEMSLRELEMNGLEILVLRFTDFSEREEAQQRIYHLALHDPLTDLPNRELFKQSLNALVEATSSNSLTALLLIDVDRFKSVNDIHGHPAGDMLLVALAERLRSCVRKCDTVARLGGDEFAILYPNIAFPNQALDLAHRILLKVAEPLTLANGSVIRPMVSIGLALTPNDATSAEALIQNADLALYTSKKRGRHRYSQFDPEMGRLFRLRQNLEYDLSFAIQNNELELHYQARMDLETRNVASYEALIRWRRDGVIVQPDDFVWIAEESGQILTIGEWVIREACQFAARQTERTNVSVNLSAKQFQDPRLKEVVETALTESGLEPRCLELEITESVLIDEDDVAENALSGLRDLGVKIALDDFGTGYSSLSYLRRFTFDTIKIDRSFIQSNDPKTWRIVQSILQMSRGLGAAVVAEGVETTDQLERLVAEGCTEIQGYIVSKPRPAADIEKAACDSLAKSIRHA